MVIAMRVTRISIDVLRSARSRREQYVGPRFPEPLLTDPYEDPARSAELANSSSMAALLVLERLSPLERAVSSCGRSSGSASPRSRRRSAGRRQRAGSSRRGRAVLRDGDVDGLRDVLAADVSMSGDSGRAPPQWGNGIFGSEKVVRLLASIFPLFVRIGGTLERHDVNGQPGAVLRDRDNLVLTTWTPDVLDGRIQAIRTVLNPEKLGHVGPVTDAWAVIREAMQARRGAD